MKKFLFISLLSLVPAYLSAQKKPLDHSVYDDWQSVSRTSVTKNGGYAIYSISPQEGDGTLTIANLKNGATSTVNRGYNQQLSYDDSWVVSLIKAPFAETREAKIKKKKADEMPKDSLAIISIQSSKVEKIPYVKSFKLPEESALYLAYELNPPADTAKKALKKEKEQGNPLVIRQLKSAKEDTIKYVSSYHFSKDGRLLVATIAPHSKDTLAEAGVLLYNTADGNRKMLSSGKGTYKNFAFDSKGKQLVYTAERDSAKADPKIHRLYYYTTAMDSASIIANEQLQGMPSGWAVSENYAPRFSENGKRLFFGTAPIPEPKDTTIVDFEVGKLDIWHYQDDYLQPMQLKDLSKEQKRSYAAVIHLDDKGKMVQLATESIPTCSISRDGYEDYALATSNTAYRITMQWEGNIRSDIYTVSLKTGKKKLVKEALSGYAQLSPNNSYITWYDRDERHYYSYSIAGGSTVCLTDKLQVNFWDEKNDVPDSPYPYGIAGWLKNDKAILLYDAYDIWQFDPTASATPVNLTNGRADKLTFRYHKTDAKAQHIDAKETILLTAFDNTSKQKGFYTKNMAKPKEKPIRRIVDKYNFSRPVKAKNNNTFLYTKSDYSTTPDLYVTTDWWKTEKQLTRINPQMKDYLWGTAELMAFKTFDGIDAEAIVCKPEDFDPAKKYPVLVYFYEKYSDNLYQHYSPAPSASVISFPFYTSRGYIVLIPDIYYTDGHPGESAYNSIVAATEELCKNTWVDKDNIGIQGQSWGGYQVCYLVTRTNMFKAAEAGAPVVNMTSAYGGIRWGTGISRQFQYEHTQSRIGKTLWDGFDLYVENSPLFFAEKVETPLLIMHNDNDGAVPWYQGIEFFTALRRLNKPVWMLQYNGEEHNLEKRNNRKDLSIRMQQFFDHYLKGDKAPSWLKYGLPATDKGKKWGYELVD